MGKSRFGYVCVLVAEGIVLVVSGLLACLYGFGVLYFALKESVFGALFFALFPAYFAAVFHWNYRFTEKLVREEIRPVEFFTWDWRSGISFLTLVSIVGVLAAIAVPQKDDVVEKGKASEALVLCDDLKTLEADIRRRTGHFSRTIPGLEKKKSALRYFDAGSIDISSASPHAWTFALTRKYPPSGNNGLSAYRFGRYRIVCGSESPELRCEGDKSELCRSKLIPQ